MAAANPSISDDVVEQASSTYIIVKAYHFSEYELYSIQKKRADGTYYSCYLPDTSLAKASYKLLEECYKDIAHRQISIEQFFRRLNDYRDDS